MTSSDSTVPVAVISHFCWIAVRVHHAYIQLHWLVNQGLMLKASEMFVPQSALARIPQVA